MRIATACTWLMRKRLALPIACMSSVRYLAAQRKWSATASSQAYRSGQVAQSNGTQPAQGPATSSGTGH